MGVGGGLGDISSGERSRGKTKQKNLIKFFKFFGAFWNKLGAFQT